MPKSTYHFGDAPCTVRVNGYKMFLSNANVELGVILKPVFSDLAAHCAKGVV